MAKQPEGVVYSSRNPNPKPSPKSFQWPDRAVADETIRQKLAATLQELLPKKNWTHVDLGRALFGANEAGQIRRIAVPRSWVKGGGPFMTEEEAGWTADLLGVPMARLLDPKQAYDPNPSMIRPKSKTGEGKNSKARKETEADDGRWILPDGLKAPSFKQSTLDDRPGWAHLEIKATVPDDVSQAIFSMLKCRPEKK